MVKVQYLVLFDVDVYPCPGIWTGNTRVTFKWN